MRSGRPCNFPRVLLAHKECNHSDMRFRLRLFTPTSAHQYILRSQISQTMHNRNKSSEPPRLPTFTITCFQAVSAAFFSIPRQFQIAISCRIKQSMISGKTEHSLPVSCDAYPRLYTSCHGNSLATASKIHFSALKHQSPSPSPGFRSEFRTCFPAKLQFQSFAKKNRR